MKSLTRYQTNFTGPEDGPEEGEIVSDDLEDISDESIIFTPCNGKSLSRSHHLNALSLSSITDPEERPLERRRKRKKSYNQRHTRRRKRSRRKLVDSDSSDDDTTLDRRLKHQFKAAVRVNVEEAHKNSLRTRLRAMVQSTSGPDSDPGMTEQKLEEASLNIIVGNSENGLSSPVKDPNIIEIELSGTESVLSVQDIIPSVSETTEIVLSAPENLESGSEVSKDDIDSELIQLRIEALKTAINNKFANRKRRKKDSIAITSCDDTNKENTNNNNGESQVKKTETKVEIPQTSQLNSEPKNDVPPSPEEDEDVLRALLLASMSKKITSVEPEPIKPTITQVQAKPVVVNFNTVTINKRTTSANSYKLNNVKKVINNVKNVVNNPLRVTKLVKMPQVKPLIINVNSDSDSDFDLSSSPEKSPKKLQHSSEKDTTVKPIASKVENNLGAAIETSVDKFLREQRAKVESEIHNVNKGGLETVQSADKLKKNVTIAKSIVSVNNRNTVVPKLVVKNAQNTKKIISSTNKINGNTNKITQALNTSPAIPSNLLLADLEKSALKFLPENKREEYKQLQNLLKLRRAQLKKPRIRRISQRVNDINNLKIALINKNESMPEKNGLRTKNTPFIINSKHTSSKNTSTVSVIQASLQNKNPLITQVLPKVKQTKAKPVNYEITRKIENSSQLSKLEARNQERRNQQLRAETRNQERKSDAVLLHSTLKQMQTRKDGRLQIQDRYKSLRPLVKKINEISKEQKNWDQEVKIILEQLAEARKKQQEVHENMSACVRDLVEKKQKMDDSLARVNNKPKVNNLITSTPVKQNIADSTLELSAVPSMSSSLSTSEEGTNESIECSLVNKHKTDSEPKDILEKHESEKLYNTWEQSTKLDNNVTIQIDNVKRVASDTDLNVVDPNDIDKIIKKTEEKVAVLEKKESFECRRSEKLRYVSPLDSVKRKEDFDPFAIMCPFEVNGTCKDPECNFKHLPK